MRTIRTLCCTPCQKPPSYHLQLDCVACIGGFKLCLKAVHDMLVAVFVGCLYVTCTSCLAVAERDVFAAGIVCLVHASLHIINHLCQHVDGNILSPAHSLVHISCCATACMTDACFHLLACCTLLGYVQQLALLHAVAR